MQIYIFNEQSRDYMYLFILFSSDVEIAVANVSHTVQIFYLRKGDAKEWDV